MTSIVLTVSQLTQAIKLQLEGTFPQVLLKGEISNLKLQSSGHMYFSLKDESAQIACVMFRQDLLKVEVPLKAGDQVIVKGQLTVYPPKGGYQLVIREISLVGLGEYLMKLELLKQKLNAKGYFSLERKRPLPPFVKRIGVITSPTGAVIRDIIHVLTRRLRGFHLILNPVRVQGDGAAGEIAQAIDEMNRYSLTDVLIVCRGGGSIEDLMPFNDEKVAEAIFKSAIPVISAVGHETDVSISDFVADVRAPTPSAAAEIVSFETEELLVKLRKYQRQCLQLAVNKLKSAKENLNRIARHPLFISPIPLLGPHMQRLDEYREFLDQSAKRIFEKNRQDFLRLKRAVELANPQRRIQENKLQLQQLEKALNSSVMRLLTEKKRRMQEMGFEIKMPELILRELSLKKRHLDQLVSHLTAINPKSVLAKGYSICFSQKDGSVITSIKDVAVDDSLRILLVDGELHTRVTEIQPV